MTGRAAPTADSRIKAAQYTVPNQHSPVQLAATLLDRLTRSHNEKGMGR